MQFQRSDVIGGLEERGLFKVLGRTDDEATPIPTIYRRLHRDDPLAAVVLSRRNGTDAGCRV